MSQRNGNTDKCEMINDNGVKDRREFQPCKFLADIICEDYDLEP